MPNTWRSVERVDRTLGIHRRNGERGDDASNQLRDPVRDDLFRGNFRAAASPSDTAGLK